jgi:biopolymer transport protein ExbD
MESEPAYISPVNYFMAEIISRNEKAGRRNHSLKVDLTPMVDLGFLLITFFVFTTTMSETKALNLVMPKDDDKGTKVAASGSFTILTSAEKLWYYEGEMPADKHLLKAVDYKNINDLRIKLFQLKNNLIQHNGNDDKMVVMIKPLADASFNSVVDMLDEMKICTIKRYALMDADEHEKKLLAIK